MAEDGLAFLAFKAWGLDRLLLTLRLVVEPQAELLASNVHRRY